MRKPFLICSKNHRSIRRDTFQHVCALLAAKRCYDSGQSLAEIAASAKKSPATIRRWLKTFYYQVPPRKGE